MAETDADGIHSSLLKVESNLKKVNILIRNQGQYFAGRSERTGPGEEPIKQKQGIMNSVQSN